MGASSWSYFVPYEQDIGAALYRLRHDVFERGDYYSLRRGAEYWEEADARLAAGEDPTTVEIERIEKRDSAPEPSSIDELFEWNEEAGTHSIIDMAEEVSETPDFGTVAPLTDDQLHAAFGTVKPTHAQVEQWAQGSPNRDPIGNLRRRWEGLYIIVYEGAIPSELYFAGFSGD